MGVKGPKDLAKALGIDRLRDNVDQELSAVIREAGQEGQEAGRHIIDTSPTPGDWSRRFRNNPRWKESVREGTGRNETGHMREMYSFHVIKDSRDEKSVEIGWVYGAPSYAADQEHGFEHEFAGWVPGMNAQEKSKPVVKKFVSDRLKGLRNKWA